MFDATSFDDTWNLLSAPVSSLTNLGTGGNGVFDGRLDEVVLVIGGVTGSAGSVVEVDFDQLSFTSGAPITGRNDPNGVPVPATVALFGLGLFALRQRGRL